MAHFESYGSYELEVLIRFDAWDCQEKHIKDMGFTTEQIQDMGWSQIGRIEDLVWLSSLMFFSMDWFKGRSTGNHRFSH